MLCGNDIELSTTDNAVKVRKKHIPVAVVFAENAGVFPTKEGNVAYLVGDAILTGVEGERWPVAREKFDATYTPVPPTRHGDYGLYSKKPVAALALQMHEAFFVNVTWRAGRLEGQVGDWLLQYGEDDYGILSQSIFEKTYELIE